ncbi:MFS transporter [Streptomyces sp. NBC_01089]|uniref:MFS transporter n=1 Tax=Streptomyces sp. NBC_01089 TaxID=2903747 RepID=UPI0038654862|nr:MFS transporter [Streptomyces sp. NBC_01089]
MNGALRARPWEVWAAAWPITVVFTLSNIPTPLLGLWQDRIGFSTGTTTVIFAAYIGGLLLVLPFTGTLADRYGSRRVLLPALTAALVSCALFMTATHVLTLIVARVLTGVAVGAALSAGTAAVAHVGGPARRPQAALAASVAIGIGLAGGPLLGGGVSQYWPAPTVTAFAIEGVLLLSALPVVYGLRPSLARPAGHPAPTGWLRLPSVPRANRRGLAESLLAYAPGMTGTSLLLALGPTLLAALLHTTNRLTTGGISFLMFGASTGIQFAVKRFPVHRILTIAGITTGTAMLAVAVAVRAHSLSCLAVAAILAGTGQGMGQYGGFSRLGAEVAPARLAEANAALSAGGYLFAGLMPILTGYLSDAAGVATSSTVVTALTAAAAFAGAGRIHTARSSRLPGGAAPVRHRSHERRT